MSLKRGFFSFGTRMSLLLNNKIKGLQLLLQPFLFSRLGLRAPVFPENHPV